MSCHPLLQVLKNVDDVSEAIVASIVRTKGDAANDDSSAKVSRLNVRVFESGGGVIVVVVVEDQGRRRQQRQPQCLDA